jgi:hydrogenase expression/formation protein HypC
MCLGVPGRVIEVRGQVAIVDYWGARRETRLDVIDELVQPGDYILNHVGYAIRKIPASEIQETLALYEVLLGDNDADLMADDVRSEIAATRDQPGHA